MSEGSGAPDRPSKVPTVRYGLLSDREHAIYYAHRWQVEHAAENTPTPSDAWIIISELLRLLPYAEVQRAIQKGDKQGHV